MANSSSLKIVSAERVDDGLLVGFSDGLSILYHTQFLYAVRDQDNNTAVPMEELDEAQETN